LLFRIQQTGLLYIFNKHYTQHIIRPTSLRCRWQTRGTRCVRSTVLYTDVDGQCDKLVTETVTSLPHWPST